MKKILLLTIFLSIIFAGDIFSNDLIVFKDGTIQLGEIVSFEKDDTVKFKSLDGVLSEYSSSSILASRTNINVDNIIAQTLSPTFNTITYYPRNKEMAYELSPRFKYQGQIFKMESGWSRETQILEFFDMIKKNKLDNNTASLINELETAMEKQSNIFKTAAITQLTGLALIMVPLFAMDDSTNPISIPSWANWTGAAGIAIDVVALGIMISQIGVNQDQYLESIAESFNENIASK